MAAVNKGLEKGLKVVHFLVTGDILEWKTVGEVAFGAGVTRNEAYAALATLEAAGWVEKGPNGFRSCYRGLVQYTLEAQDCLGRQAARLGLKKD